VSRSLKLRWWVIAPALLLLALILDRPKSRPLHDAEWLEAGDTHLRTVRAGRGDTTLLLLHGFGESLFTWRAVFDPLAVDRRVIAIDLPGQGASGKPDASYTLEAVTHRLADFVDRWTNGPVILIGHSMGGELAGSLALARPDRVVGLILIAPAGWQVGLGGIADSMYPGKAAALGWYFSSRAFVLPEHDPDWLREPDSLAGYSLTGDPAYRRSTTRILEEFDFRGMRNRFRDVKQPVLLLWGGLDPVIPFAYADSIARELPCARLLAFPRALHRPQAEIPDQTLAGILSFLSRPQCSGEAR
jgi:pyruvate dehydrogenase E2 component (dihydrolipoamide acetyltransferase)